VVVRNVNSSGRCLSQCGYPELQVISSPSLLLDGKHLTEFVWRGFQAGLEASNSFIPAQAMRDGNDKWLGHYLNRLFSEPLFLRLPLSATCYRCHSRAFHQSPFLNPRWNAQVRAVADLLSLPSSFLFVLAMRTCR
jgi:hypothetical protein